MQRIEAWAQTGALWLGAGLLLTTSLFHVGVEGSGSIVEALGPIADAWLAIHIAQVVALGCIGVGVIHLSRDMHSIPAVLSRMFTLLYMFFYIAADAAAGIGTGIVLVLNNQVIALNDAMVSLDPTTVEGILYSLLESKTTHAIFFAASASWSLAVASLLFVLHKKGYSLWSEGPLFIAGGTFFFGHGPILGVITALALLPVALEDTLRRLSERNGHN
ncbi:hypothetical protein EXS56_02105 [Candidatus Kaiserbacteria bacterium]|nr:hypothetical protein [Candidatus Kaiserbacteria bacterium]